MHTIGVSALTPSPTEVPIIEGTIDIENIYNNNWDKAHWFNTTKTKMYYADPNDQDPQYTTEYPVNLAFSHNMTHLFIFGELHDFTHSSYNETDLPPYIFPFWTPTDSIYFKFINNETDSWTNCDIKGIYFDDRVVDAGHHNRTHDFYDPENNGTVDVWATSTWNNRTGYNFLFIIPFNSYDEKGKDTVFELDKPVPIAFWIDDKDLSHNAHTGGNSLTIVPINSTKYARYLQIVGMDIYGNNIPAKFKVRRKWVRGPHIRTIRPGRFFIKAQKYKRTFNGTYRFVMWFDGENFISKRSLRVRIRDNKTFLAMYEKVQN